MFPTIHGVLGGATAAANWYDGAIAAYQPLGAASLAASYLDLTGNGRNLTVGVAPSWASGTGWTFDGSTQYLRGITSNSSYSILIAYTNAVASTTGIVGEYLSSTQSFMLAPNRTSQVWYLYGDLTYARRLVPPALASGVLGMTPTGGYRNGVADGIPFVSGISAGNQQIFIGAVNDVGTPKYQAANIQAVGIWDTTLDAATVATKSAQMAAL